MRGVDVVTLKSDDLVEVVLARLVSTLKSRGIEVFTIIDHSGEAKRVGQHLRETKLVIFGSPSVGTALMQTQPLIALDLPLKILIWAGDDGETCVSYDNPSALAKRYGISDPSEMQTLSSVEVLASLIVRSSEA
jgi:uncharacterized protein (DUF302 family)